MATNTVREHPQTISSTTCDLHSSLTLPLSFSTKELNKISHSLQMHPLLHKNDYLYHVNTEFSCIYTVRSGCIKTVTTDVDGNEQITGFFLPGEVVDSDNFGQDQYTNSAIAVDTSSVCKIPLSQLDNIGVQMPSFQKQILHIMGREATVDPQLISQLTKNKAEAKIASFLLSLSSRYRRLNLSATNLILPMSRSDIGNYLGLTIETVSRIIAKLRKKEIIEASGREILIHDLDQLQVLAGIAAKPRVTHELSV